MKKSLYFNTKIACYLGYVIQAVVNNLLSLFFVVFNAKPYGISLEHLGRLVLYNFLAQLAIDLFSVYIVPKFGCKNCVIIAQIMSALGFVSMGLLPRIISPYYGLLISVLALATGSGFIEVLISPIVEALPNDNKSGSMSFLHSFYCWGQVLTVVVTTLFILIFGKDKWYYIAFLWSILPIINTLLFYKADIIDLNSDSSENLKSPFSVFKEKNLYIYFLFMVCAGATELSMAQWSSFFIETGFGVSKWLGDLIGPCFFAVLMGIGRMSFGFLGDKIKLERVLLAGSALCVVCYLTVALSTNSVVCVFACGFCGLGVSIMWPGVLSLAAKNCRNKSTSVFSFMALFGDLGCSIGPWLIGFIADFTVLNAAPEKLLRLFGMNINQFALHSGFLVCAVFPLIMFAFSLPTALKKQT